MISLLILWAFWIPQAETFANFSFCRENPRGLYVEQCFRLDGEGKGVFVFTPQNQDSVEVPFAFSKATAERFLDLLEETRYLEEGERYESGRNVANMGMKRLSIEGPWGLRTARFNYSTLREVTALTTFFERLIAQEMLLFDTEVALEFDRLGIPDRLEQIESEARRDRLVDSERVIALLERIEETPGLVNYAKTTATRIREEILKRAD